MDSNNFWLCIFHDITTVLIDGTWCKISFVDKDSARNMTIEERVALLEIQVVDLDEDVDFLFDEQIIQDERIFSLEQTSIDITADVEGNYRRIC